MKSIKISFELSARFTKTSDEGKIEGMDQYFYKKDPHVFFDEGEGKIGEDFDKFIEKTKGEIDAWSERGSGWNFDVKNRDNECLEWALRAALFPPKDGKDPPRPSKYPVNDGINYEGIDFPTPLKHIDKLEAQNANLATNVFGWENN